jgi:hypothetical protein
VIKGAVTAATTRPPPPSLFGMRPCQGDRVKATGGGQGREAAFMSAFLLEETQSTATGRSELLPYGMSALKPSDREAT